MVPFSHEGVEGSCTAGAADSFGSAVTYINARVAISVENINADNDDRIFIAVQDKAAGSSSKVRVYMKDDN